MNSEINFIDSYLKKCSQVLKRITIFETGILFLIIFSVVTFVAIIISYFTSDVTQIRIIFFSLSGLIFLSFLSYILILNSRKFGNSMYLASFVEDKLKNLDDGLKTVTALKQESRKFFSEGLFDALIFSVSGRLKSSNPRTLVSVKGPIKILLIFIGILFILMGISLFFPAETSQGFNRIFSFYPTSFSQSSETYPIATDELVSDIIITIEYPPYTKKEKKIFQGTSGDFSALKGSTVFFNLISLQNIKNAYFVIKKTLNDRETAFLPLQIDKNNNLKFIMTAKEPYYWTLRITSESGLIFQERKWRYVEIFDDTPPNVIAHADSKEKKQKGERVDIDYNITDDFGITQVDLIYRDTGEVSNRKKILMVSDKKILSGSYSFVIPDSLNEDTHSIEVFFEAFDNDNIKGPNKGTSNKIVFEIDTPSSRHKEVQILKEKVFEGLIKNLEMRLLLTKENPTSSVAHLRMAHDHLKNILKAWEDLPLLLRKDPMNRGKNIEHYETLLSRFIEFDAEEDKILNGVLASEIEKNSMLPEIENAYTHSKYLEKELENTILALEELIDRENKEYLLTLGKELNSLKAEFNELLKKLSRDPEEKKYIKEVLQKLEHLQNKIKHIEEEMARQAKLLPYDNYNIKRDYKDGQVSLLNSLNLQISRIKELVESNDFETAVRLLNDVQNNIDSLLAQWSIAVGETDISKLLNARTKLIEFAGEIEGLIDKEREALENTADLSHSYQKRSQLFSESVVERTLSKIATKVEKAMKYLEENDKKVLYPEDLMTLNSLIEDTENLLTLLTKGEVEASEKLAGKISKEFSSLGSDIFEQAYLNEEKETAEILKENARNIKSAGVYLKQASKELENLIPKSDEFFTPEEISKMKTIRSQQESVKGKLDGVRIKVSEFAGEFPVLSSQSIKSLDEANQSILDSIESLDDYKPRTAEMHQRVVIQNLLKFKHSIERILSGASQEFVKNPAYMEKVEIPQAGDTEVSKTFKEEIERAMKETSVKKYEKLIKKYFESLLK